MWSNLVIDIFQETIYMKGKFKKMFFECVFVLFLKQIGKNNIKNARMLNTTQKYRRVGEHFPSKKTIIHRYRHLVYDQHKVQATYIWIDGTGENIRLKDRILKEIPKLLEDIPKWSYAENSPYHTVDKSSVEMILYPRAIYRNPFKPGKHDVIVMCDTYQPDGSPFHTNHRHAMQTSIDRTTEQEPIFGIEQKYTLLDKRGQPFERSKNELIKGMNYCGVGFNRVYARDLVESHALACLHAGIDFSGTNAEEIPLQWKYKIGPSVGIKAADDLWVSRYILVRIAEEFGICVTFHPKSIKGDWNETRAYTNYSTAAMRADGGIKAIRDAIKLLENEHYEHIKDIDPHHYKIDRSVSIRVAESGKGFLEDRRPPSNMDPYAVCNAILTATLLKK